MSFIETIAPTIIFFSPNGTTRDVASWFVAKLSAINLKPEQIDFTRRTRQETREIAAAVTSRRRLLVVGTPVYVGHPPKPVIDFLRNLAVQQDGSVAIIYAMYGGVTCGSALKEMAVLLHKRNVEVLAAARLVAKHSLMLDQSRDRFADRPSTKEEVLVDGLVEKIKAWYSAGILKLDLEKFQYMKLPPRSLLGKLVARVVSIRFIFPPKHDASRCTSCGRCIENCSTRCLRLTSGNKVLRGKDCVKCFNCLRSCPNHAWSSPFVAAFPRLHKSSAKKKQESTVTVIFD
nr:EFR1 family ferrodoxin [Candidatus Sigynarchaeota archaeon]